MEKIVLYGAGNYCQKLLKDRRLKEYEIIGVLDGDSGKWNKNFEGFIVKRPEDLKGLCYDKLVITAKAYQGIAGKLVTEFGIPQEKILCVDFDNNRIEELNNKGMAFAAGQEAVVERELFRRMACQTIEEGLLLECLMEGEFEEYTDVVVVGEEQDFGVVQNFFSAIRERVFKVRMENPAEAVKSSEKYILTSASYKKDLVRLQKQRGCSAEQCVVVPLFDVANTVIV